MPDQHISPAEVERLYLLLEKLSTVQWQAICILAVGWTVKGQADFELAMAELNLAEMLVVTLDMSLKNVDRHVLNSKVLGSAVRGC